MCVAFAFALASPIEQTVLWAKNDDDIAGAVNDGNRYDSAISSFVNEM